IAGGLDHVSPVIRLPIERGINSGTMIDISLRIAVCSVWSSVGDVEPECLWLGDIELLLVAFDSQLKVFYPFKNDNTSGKHP
nr:hypothetical protein [Tanacetum cinerariifolium]